MGKADFGVKEGQIVADKYRVLSLLGRGGMGSVWRCEHLSLGSEVALKIIKPAISENNNALARFLREARAAARLRSPHVVQILDHGQDGELAYIAMEMLEGESLYGRLKREKKLSLPLTVRIATHIGRAIARAHQAGITHRDLKPDNVFLVQNDDEIIAKVLDFGIAKSSGMLLETSGQGPHTQTGALLGTPYYMSPEQATAQKDVDHRSDLWSLAVIVYECLLGERPYRSDSLGDLVLQICMREQPIPSQRGPVPATFDSWWAHAQQRHPENRFQSAKQLTRALRTALLDEDGRPRSPANPAGPLTPAATPAALPAAPLTPIVATDQGFPLAAAGRDALASPPTPTASPAALTPNVATDQGFPLAAAGRDDAPPARRVTPTASATASPSTASATTSPSTASATASATAHAAATTAKGLSPAGPLPRASSLDGEAVTSSPAATLEALTSAGRAPQGRRSVIVLVAAALTLLLVGAVASRLTSGRDDRAGPAASATARPSTRTEAAPAPSAVPAPTPSATAAPAPSASSGATAAPAPSASARASAAVVSPPPRRPTVAPRPLPRHPPRHPPSGAKGVPAADDPLDI